MFFTRFDCHSVFEWWCNPPSLLPRLISIYLNPLDDLNPLQIFSYVLAKKSQTREMEEKIKEGQTQRNDPAVSVPEMWRGNNCGLSENQRNLLPSVRCYFASRFFVSFFRLSERHPVLIREYYFPRREKRFQSWRKRISISDIASVIIFYFDPKTATDN